jgi:male-specific lethal 1
MSFITEAEYAFQLKKKIVPLKMEKNYKADGWLGFIIGAKLFFDFSGKYPFENKITELIKDVQVSLNTQNGHVVEIAVPEVKVHVAVCILITT